MAVISKIATGIVAVASALFTVQAQRPMENLGRGVAAVRANETAILVSWRLLGLDPDGIGFNVYRASGNGDAEKLNGEVLTKGTNFVDDDANSEADNTYHVRTVVDGEEGDKSGSFTLSGDHEVEPVIRIPLEDTGNIKYAWVGDLDGDGEYDYVVDRTGDQQAIEAYHRNGTLLWTVDLGANSENQNNISPGSTAISVGNWDGVTVYDFDSDGRAEVALRIANGVTFGDGESFKHDNDDEQFIAFLDGETGALLSKAEIPTDYIEDGPLASRLGVGYLDGKTPYLVAFMKNRQESGDFNLIYAAYTFDGEASMAWKWLRGDQKLSDGHNGRIVDADRDGVDEIHEIGFTLNGDGTLKYSLRDYDIIHGDRFYVAKIDPDQDGLQGYGIQQDNENLITDYYYDAAEGKVIWTHKGDEVYDVGRGVIGDIDPTSPGLEVWHFDGVWSALENESLTNSSLYPWPQMTILWDGDELAELFNDGKVEKWDYENPSVPRSVPRIFKVGDYGGVTVGNGNPIFIGDILGDWREEFITINSDSTELLVFTTNEPTDIRLYTLAHNPAYRNDMTLKGYMQSHYVDYYLGADMSTPDQPDIKYVE